VKIVFGLGFNGRLGRGLAGVEYEKEGPDRIRGDKKQEIMLGRAVLK
jgi:hypothetical protein